MTLTRKTIFGIIALALIAGAAGWYWSESDHPGALPLTSLDAASFPQLKNEFNQASENVRVIVLLSPT